MTALIEDRTAFAIAFFVLYLAMALTFAAMLNNLEESGRRKKEGGESVD